MGGDIDYRIGDWSVHPSLNRLDRDGDRLPGVRMLSRQFGVSISTIGAVSWRYDRDWAWGSYAEIYIPVFEGRDIRRISFRPGPAATWPSACLSAAGGRPCCCRGC